MKNVISFILTLMMSVSFAFAGSEKNLKSAFEEFQYAMTVEWDQHDQAFHDQAVSNFQSEIKALQAAGLTNEDLMAFASSQVKDQSQVEGLENAFIAMKNKSISHDQFVQVVNQSIKNSQMKGAAWTDDASLMTFVGIIFVVLILASVYNIPVQTSVGVTF